MSHARVEREPISRGRSLAIVACIYLLALAAGALALVYQNDPTSLTAAFVADIVATGVVFGGSLALRNASVYDAYWSVLPLALVTVWAQQAPPDVPVLQVALVVGGVWLWGLRLTYNWARGWGGLHEEDWRYAMLRERTGRAYPAVNLLGIHLFPTVQVFAGLVPAWAALRTVPTDAAAPSLVALGAAVVFGAVVIEAVADAQLARFVASDRPAGSVITTGLWRWSRHPNYFGEVSFWWGLALLAIGAGAPLWTAGGAVAITAMFVFVSIPMMERRQRERRPAFRDILRTTSMLVPLPRRSGDDAVS